MKQKAIKVGDILNVGNGVTAEVLAKGGSKYYLRFTNGEEGLFTETSIRQGVYRKRAKYLGAVKEFGDGFKLVVTDVDVRKGKCIVEYRHNDSVITRGIIDSSAFDCAEGLTFDVCGKFYLDGVELTVVDITLHDLICVTVCYEKFGTTYCFSADGHSLIEEKRAIFNRLFGKNKSFYITKDSKLIYKGKSYELKDGLDLITVYWYEEDNLISKWLTEAEYFQYMSLYSDGDFSVSKEVLYEGKLYEIVAIPCDNDDSRILRFKGDAVEYSRLGLNILYEVNVEDLRRGMEALRR